jgi:chromosome segregation ATPase
MSTKQAYEQKLESKLDEWNAKIDVLKAKAKGVGADAKLKQEKAIKELERKQADAKGKLQQLKEEGENTWEKMKDGLEETVSDIESNLESVIEQLR